jgi:hypothetical protein
VLWLVPSAACVVCVASLAACGSSANSSDSQAREADAGPDAAPAVDATAPSEDAGTDASEAGRDAAPGPGRYCTKLVPVPRFCDDFDDGDLTNDWTQFASPAGAVFELDTSKSTSAPASFHVIAKATAAAASNNALLRLTLLGAVSHGKLAFDVLLPSVTFDKGAIAIARFHINLDDAYTLYLRGPDYAANVPMLEEYVGGMVTTHMLTKLPAAGAWTRVAIDLDLAGGKASVSFGADKALDAVAIGVQAGTEATVRLGAIVDGPADAFEARFDDVVLDF